MQNAFTILAMFGILAQFVSGYSLPMDDPQAAPKRAGSKRMLRSGASSPDAASKIESSIWRCRSGGRRRTSKDTQRREGETADPDHDPSVFPLAIPLIAGPGAIASMILLVGQSGPGWGDTLAVLGLMLATMLVTCLFLLAAPPLERLLGRTGTIVITRLLGMLLAALSVQFVIDGVRGTGLIG